MSHFIEQLDSGMCTRYLLDSKANIDKDALRPQTSHTDKYYSRIIIYNHSTRMPIQIMDIQK